MKKSIIKILAIMLILVSTIVLLPSCKDKPEEPEIMPYGVYYFVSYHYSEGMNGVTSNWYMQPDTKKRIDIVNKAMEYYGYYFVFTPDKIIFGGSLQSQTDYKFKYNLAVGPGISYDGSLKLNYDNFNEDSKLYVSNYLAFYYEKSNKSPYTLKLAATSDNLQLKYVYYHNTEVPAFIFDGTPYGDTEILKRDPINYNDYI